LKKCGQKKPLTIKRHNHDMSKIPLKWEKSAHAIKATQIAFDTSVDVTNQIRAEAAMQGLSPSDMVRQIVGLDVISKPKRPRLTVSLSDQDYTLLAKRYQMEHVDKLEIKKRMYSELIQHHEKS